MAHLIDESNGRASCFTAGEKAWHGLGVNVADAQTSKEAMRLANLDWEVRKHPLFFEDPNESCSFVEIEGAYSIIRQDTQKCLGLVGEQYTPFQNAEAFEFMDSLVGEKLAMYETAGAIRDGAQVWLLARLPKEYRIGKNDVVKPYVLLATSHDGNGAIKLYPTSVRVVCNNTLTYANQSRQGGEGLNLRHTSSLKGRVEEARKKLGIVLHTMDEMEVRMQAMARAKLSKKAVRGYFESLFPTKVKPAGILDFALDASAGNQDVVSSLLDAHYAETERAAKKNELIMELVLGNYENERNTLPGMAHSVWAAYNSVSEWADHQLKAKDHTESVLFGSANAIKQDAWQKALALTA